MICQYFAPGLLFAQTTVSGAVFAADTGQAVRGATVRALVPDTIDIVSVTTDDDGRYALTLGAPARYMLTAAKEGFVALSYGQRAPTDPSRLLDLQIGQSQRGLTFSLPRAGVITGIVRDRFGDPAPGLTLMAMRATFTQGRSRLSPVGRPAVTNDIGEYRLFGLPPGRYYVVATAPKDMAPQMQRGDAAEYVSTFFPGAASSSEATPLTLALSEVLQGANFSLSGLKSATISGTAFTSDGGLMNGGTVALAPSRPETVTFKPLTAAIASNGAFTLTGVPPGTFQVRAIPTGSRDGGLEVAADLVTVNGENIDGLSLRAAKPARIHGRVVLDQAGSIRIPPKSIRLMFTQFVDEQSNASPSAAVSTLNEDFTFSTESPPGDILVRLASAIVGWDVKRVLQGGRDVTSGMRLLPGDETDGVIVELSNRWPTIEGHVSDRSGGLVNCVILVFSATAADWTRDGFVRLIRPDQYGRFSARLPSEGKYLVATVGQIDSTTWSDPVFLESLRSTATVVLLTDSSAKALEIVIR